MKDNGITMFGLGAAAILLIGWVVYPYIIYKKVDQPIKFSHFIHTGDNVGLKCEDCHSFEKDGRFHGVPEIAKCKTCHSTTPMGISGEEERLVNDYIKPGNEIPWVIYSKQPQNVFFSHATHVLLARIDCQSCHFGQAFAQTLRPAYISRVSGYSLDVFGKNFLNLPSTPSRGMRMDDCSNCHYQRGVQESCIACHK